jgi:hypothetical protein
MGTTVADTFDRSLELTYTALVPSKEPGYCADALGPRSGGRLMPPLPGSGYPPSSRRGTLKPTASRVWGLCSNSQRATCAKQPN